MLGTHTSRVMSDIQALEAVQRKRHDFALTNSTKQQSSVTKMIGERKQDFYYYTGY